MLRVNRDGSLSGTSPFVQHNLKEFVTVSQSDRELMDEYTAINKEYDELHKRLVELPLRKAAVIRKLLANNPKRMYKDVAEMLSLTPSRIGQILRAGDRPTGVGWPAHKDQEAA